MTTLLEVQPDHAWKTIAGKDAVVDVVYTSDPWESAIEIRGLELYQAPNDLDISSAWASYLPPVPPPSWEPFETFGMERTAQYDRSVLLSFGTRMKEGDIEHKINAMERKLDQLLVFMHDMTPKLQALLQDASFDGCSELEGDLNVRDVNEDCEEHTHAVYSHALPDVEAMLRSSQGLIDAQNASLGVLKGVIDKLSTSLPFVQPAAASDDALNTNSTDYFRELHEYTVKDSVVKELHQVLANWDFQATTDSLQEMRRDDQIEQRRFFENMKPIYELSVNAVRQSKWTLIDAAYFLHHKSRMVARRENTSDKILKAYRACFMEDLGVNKDQFQSSDVFLGDCVCDKQGICGIGGCPLWEPRGDSSSESDFDNGSLASEYEEDYELSFDSDSEYVM